MNLQTFRPEVFQGNLKMKNYFEGWYFKHVSQDLNYVYSFIPGISLTNDDPHAFIQIINGITGKSDYVTYPVEEFSWETERLFIKVGNSVFTENYIDLDIDNETIKVKGHLNYSRITKYPSTIFSPGIMGWYSFVPFMECKHGIVSVNHFLSGTVQINDESIDFTKGKGYGEKDWGTSFPEAWIWIQANSFKDENSSFNFSVAKIPWRGKFFIGFIAFLYYNERFYKFSTHNKSTIVNINHSDGNLDLVLKNHKSTLRVQVLKSSFGELMAPVAGEMSRRIKESIDSEVTLVLSDNDQNLIYTDTSKRAGLEIIEKIFEYI
jgi:hypothetical protein